MKVKLDGKTIDIKAVWIEKPDVGIVRMIDQRFLPWRFQFYDSHNVSETVFAIKNFVVRGAPTIGATAAFGVYQATLEALNSNNFAKKFQELLTLLKGARPTAYNLFHAVNTLGSKILRYTEDTEDPGEIRSYALELARNYVESTINLNRKIGEYGNKLIKDGAKILTHCNAGALAAVDIGTATAPIYHAHDSGKKIVVYVDETRPWLQGARLTAWELTNYGIENYVISDNAAGYLMWLGEIDLVIVGADRIALNGDTANKIGTYKLALAAKDNGIPFYVAAPTTTIDPELENGRGIPIEERSLEEIHYVRGEYKGDIISVRVTPLDAKARNPVFDVTPARLITGFITERGIIPPNKIKDLVKI